MPISSAFPLDRGESLPMGLSRYSTQNLQWHNFSIFAPEQSARLEIRDQWGQDVHASLDLDARFHRTGQIWHVAVAKLPPLFSYSWRFGHPLGQSVCDPRAELLAGEHIWGQRHLTSAPPLLESSALVTPRDEFDWKDDIPPRHLWKELVIYEMHVRGFTQHISSQCAPKGTFQALASKLPYLKWLGVTAIELMPICEFDEGEYRRLNPVTNRSLYNYWGYSTRHFFAPMRAFAEPASSPQARLELKELVRQAHLLDIEVLLDVVYNHTGEGNELGSTVSFKALAEEIYYLKDRQGAFVNHSGCGNTFNANHPIVAELIIDSLRHWVREYRIDGFRFDLATLLMRTPDDQIDERSPLLAQIAGDPLLADVKLIAEPWDPSGVYRVGNFPFGNRFCEWNDRFRDDVRRFLNFGEKKGDFASRLCGSQDLFGARAPHNSINFITCHDGFSLRDLVSFGQKHNEENAEENRDGSKVNISFNFGCEGSTDDPLIKALRERQMKNFLLALMISQGVPLIQSGDEYGQSRGGNNNSWCHDDERNWFGWNLMKSSSLPRFTRQLIALRRDRLPLESGFLTKENVIWHGLEPNRPEWGQEDGLIALTLEAPKGDLFIAFNAQTQRQTLKVPLSPSGRGWHLAVMTSERAPDDIFEEGQEPLFSSKELILQAHSAAILVQRDEEKAKI